MEVLLRFDGNRRPENINRNERAKAAFSFVRETYNDTTDVKDAYLYEPDDDSGFAEEVEFVDGMESPDEIRQIAEKWNLEIQTAFDKTLKRLTEQVQENADGTRNWLQAKSTTIYEMKKAAMALDNSFYAFADKALLVNKNEYFTTILTEAELQDILNHPENYAVVDVCTK